MSQGEVARYTCTLTGGRIIAARATAQQCAQSRGIKAGRDSQTLAGDQDQLHAMATAVGLAPLVWTSRWHVLLAERAHRQSVLRLVTDQAAKSSRSSGIVYIFD